MRNLSSWAAACAVATALAPTVALANYPERDIIFTVPFGAGGNADIGVRTAEPFLEKCLGGEIIVVNKPGASGKIGFAEISSSAPDGYNLGLVNTPNFFSYPIVENTPFTKDSFELLGSAIGSISTISVRADSPLNSIADLVKAAKESDKPITVGLPGIGGGDHLVIARFADEAGLTFTYVPMTDGNNVQNALMGGHIDVTVIAELTAVQFKDEVKAIATARDQRSDMLPDTPTFKEQGYDIVTSSLHIFAAPAGIPAEVKQKLTDCLTETSKNPDFIAQAEQRNLVLLPHNAEEAKKVVDNEDEYYRDLWKRKPWQ